MRGTVSSVAAHMSPGRKILKLKKDAVIPTMNKADTNSGSGMSIVRRTSYTLNNAEKSNGKDTKPDFKAGFSKQIPASIFSVDSVDKKVVGYADYALAGGEKAERAPGDITRRNTDPSYFIKTAQ
jgi:hypothetical protein